MTTTPLDPLKAEQLKTAIAHLQQRWGPRALVAARAAPPPAGGLSTGFPDLDRLLGEDGVPLNALTLIAGAMTSGKLTLAYKILSQAQHAAATAADPRHLVALLDLNATSDFDYIARCGVSLDHLLLVRPSSGQQTLRILLDLVRSHQLRAILLDSLDTLAADLSDRRALENELPQLNLALKPARCALVVLDEAEPPWQPRPTAPPGRALSASAALHIEIERQEWVEEAGQLRGYRAWARLVKSRRARTGQVARLSIEFPATVRSRETW